MGGFFIAKMPIADCQFGGSKLWLLKIGNRQ
jgi:hypothetical protein